MATKKTSKPAVTPSVADDDYSFFKKIKVGDRYADKLIRHPNFGYCDSGSYIFNALLSGDLFGGFPLNKIIMVAGKQQSGKSFIAKNNFAYGLMQKGYFIYWYDTEGETTEEELEEQNGFNPDQYKLVKEITTVEDYFISVNGVINDLEVDRGDSIEVKRKCAIVLDSQGELSTEKAINDATKGEIKSDMTKAKLLAGMYRSITNRCANLGIPMFITNHIYMDSSGAMYGNPEKIAGGEGAQFSASIILSLHKSYQKKGKDDEITGVILNATVTKSRMVKAKLKAPIYVDYNRGIDRYYGLQQIAEHAGLIEKWNKDDYGHLAKPIDKTTGKTTRKDCWVVKDPNKDPSEWRVFTEMGLYCKAGLGSILEPLNEYIKAEFKFRPPKLRRDDEELDLDESEVEAAEKDAEKDIKAEIKYLEEAEKKMMQPDKDA